MFYTYISAVKISPNIYYNLKSFNKSEQLITRLKKELLLTTKIAKQIFEYVEQLPNQMQEETLDFVRFLKRRAKNRDGKPQQTEPNGTRLARLMKEASGENLFSHIKDPSAWQREIRKAPPLDGRGE